MRSFIEMAKKGRCGDERRRSKDDPIHDGDLAQVCADAIEGKTGDMMQVGRRSSRGRTEIGEPRLRRRRKARRASVDSAWLLVPHRS